MLSSLNTEPLVEFGLPVIAQFGKQSVPAQRHLNSGYVFFKPPSRNALSSYYQREYAESQTNYYTVESDYEPGKNGYHTERILEVFTTLMNRSPRNSFELGCAYGGLVASMAGRGIDAKGSDINQDAICQGRNRKGNQRIISAANLNALATLTEPVDLIYSIHTLEHDPDMFKVIEACREKLSEDGLLFVSVPNAMFTGSVVEGFFNNMWATYPQHLHMLSPGFIPFLCEETSLSPLFWDTRIVFDVQPSLRNLFSPSFMGQTARDLWTTMLCQAGHGMELNFALTPKRASSSPQLIEKAKSVRECLENARLHEIKIRAYLRNASLTRCEAMLDPAPLQRHQPS